MMSNDGASVYSFDEYGPLLFVEGEPRETTKTRADALGSADIIITGVPTEHFELIQPGEIGRDSVCVNFSSVPNFAESVPEAVRTYIPRVGPMTVAMSMRNTIRLFENFHQ